MSGDRAVSSLNRVALLVDDVEQSARFYTDVLGMRPLYHEGDIPPDQLPQLIRLLGLDPAGQMRFRFLSAGDETRTGLVALFEVQSAPAVPPAANPRLMARGEACLVFFHPDLDGLIMRLEDDGCRLLSPPESLATARGAQREVVVRNRDGTLFNFIERPADQSSAT